MTHIGQRERENTQDRATRERETIDRTERTRRGQRENTQIHREGKITYRKQREKIE